VQLIELHGFAVFVTRDKKLKQAVFPMKCVLIQDIRKLRTKDNIEANLGILEFLCIFASDLLEI
jgi:hypothetical protein